MTWTIDFSECRGVWEVRLYVWPATDSHRLLQCLGHKPIEEPTGCGNSAEVLFKQWKCTGIQFHRELIPRFRHCSNLF
ncbi:uncharacterized protein [Bos mutus]|uniref:uncharacterized protein isoform X4 n=1 Tax=Bos mutus TaxID=72004 RepID=UPI0038B5DDB8